MKKMAGELAAEQARKELKWIRDRVYGEPVMDMREAFEKAASSMALDPLFDYKKQRYYSQRTQGAWEVWQHLYPEIERLKGLAKDAFFEGGNLIAGACMGTGPEDGDWDTSTTKARLEGWIDIPKVLRRGND